MSPVALDPIPPNMACTTEQQHRFPLEADQERYALDLDAQDPLRTFRDKYIIPTKSSLRSQTLCSPDQTAPRCEQAVYLCGNSLGLQPKATAKYIHAHLDTWSSKGVYGHFTQVEDSPLKPWQDMAECAARQSARLVGALPEEVAVMNSLSVNLHLLLASFYRPEGRRRKILMERKAFPSDHYVVESQVRWHGLDPEECMILLEPDEDHLFSTEGVMRVIEEEKEEIALVLLPGIQYYTGQLFEMQRLTRFAHEKGLVIGWDLAHAAGNVELKLKEWDVDFAAWCTYKYMNAGPGSIAGIFVNEKYGKVETEVESGRLIFRPRLMGWYGGDKASRFKMDNSFRPTPGAGGYQVSNPSAIDLASLCASLSVFDEISMEELRQKSLRLTAYLQHLLLKHTSTNDSERPFRIITPLDPSRRGAQLSVLLKPGLLKKVAATLKDAGVVADQREPDVVRVAPVPMYNTYHDVWYFAERFTEALAS